MENSKNAAMTVEKIKKGYEIIKNAQGNVSEITPAKAEELAKTMLLVLDEVEKNSLYEQDLKLVSDIFKLALQIIKAELLTNGSSLILDWLKEDHQKAECTLNYIIRNELNALDSSLLTNEIMKNEFDELQKNGFPLAYLNESTIVYIALQEDFKGLNQIEENLLILYNQMLDTTISMQKQDKERLALVDRIGQLQAKPQKINLIKEIGIIASFVGILSCMSVGIFRGLTSSHKVYKTDKIVYSTNDVKQTQEGIYYEPKIDGVTATQEVVYGPWKLMPNRHDIYEREITTYTLNPEIGYTSLEDYLNVPAEERRVENKKNTDTEKRKQENLNTAYTGSITEIVRLIQDQDKSFYDEDKISLICAVALSIATPLAISSSLAFIEYKTRRKIVFGAIYDLITKINEKKKNEEELDLLLNKIKQANEVYRRLGLEKDILKNSYVDLFEQTQDQVQNEKIKETYMRLKREK